MKKNRPFSFLRRLYIAIGLILLNILFGISGFIIFDNQSLSQAIYSTIVILSTVGLGLSKELSEPGRWFVVVFILLSIGIFAYAVSVVTSYIMEGGLLRYFRGKRVKKEIDKLDGHVIVCGYGRNGQQAAQTLKAHHIPFIVIEKNEQLMLKELSERDDILHLEGDSTDDELLRLAGVERARALITTLPVDAENVFIVLSARSLNPLLKIISRSSEAATVPKLKKAGADNVIMPDWVGGTHMATLVSKPDVIEFIDFISGEQGQSINIESVAYNDLPAELKGKNIKEIMEWKRTGVNCIGIKNPEGKFIINPPDDTEIISGMKIMLLGSRHQIMQMKGNLQ